LKIGRIEYAIPEQILGRMSFVFAELQQADGSEISDVLYPIAVGEDLHDFNGIFPELDGMSPATVKAEFLKSRRKPDSTGTEGLTLQVSNPTDKLAFFVRVRLREESRTLRTAYRDNYISLLSGQSKPVVVRVESKETPLARLHFEVACWNCQPQKLELDFAK